MSILFSIIIPTYKRNDLLSLCLDCLSPNVQNISQNIYEIIVTDDAQDLGTKKLISEKYPWVKYTHGPRKGPATNRNHGASIASGIWLVFTDDDCLPENGWLKAFYDYTTNFPYPKVLEGKTICKEGIKSPLMTAPINETGGYLWSCNFAIEKSFFNKLGGFNPSFPFPNMEDVDFRERIFSLNELIKFLPDAVVDHPPRKVKLGKEMALQTESSFYFWKIIQKKKRVGIKVVTTLIKFRLNALRSHRLTIDSLVFAFAFIEELFITIYLVFIWERKKY